MGDYQNRSSLSLSQNYPQPVPGRASLWSGTKCYKTGQNGTECYKMEQNVTLPNPPKSHPFSYKIG